MITRKLRFFYWVLSDRPSWAEMLCFSAGGMLNNLPMATVEVEVYHVWWEFDTDTFPPFSLLTFPHHGGIFSWWEYAGEPSSSLSSPTHCNLVSLGPWSWCGYMMVYNYLRIIFESFPSIYV